MEREFRILDNHGRVTIVKKALYKTLCVISPYLKIDTVFIGQREEKGCVCGGGACYHFSILKK